MGKYGIKKGEYMKKDEDFYPSPLQMRLIRLRKRGLTIKEIAERLCLSPREVKKALEAVPGGTRGYAC